MTMIDEEVSLEVAGVPDAQATFDQLVGRLSVQSVNKHFDAYDDIPWDDPAYAIDRTDPR